MVYSPRVRDELARGDLVPVLERFSTPFPGFYLYYPQRRSASPALRALIDHLKDGRGNVLTGNAKRRSRDVDPSPHR